MEGRKELREEKWGRGEGKKEKKSGGRKGENIEKEGGEEEKKGGRGGKEYCAYERKCRDGLPIRRAQRAITLRD